MRGSPNVGERLTDSGRRRATPQARKRWPFNESSAAGRHRSARGRGRIPGGGSLASRLRDQVERCGRGVTRLRELDVNLASRVLELTGAARDGAVEALFPRLNTLDGAVRPPGQRCGQGELDDPEASVRPVTVSAATAIAAATIPNLLRMLLPPWRRRKDTPCWGAARDCAGRSGLPRSASLARRQPERYTALPTLCQRGQAPNAEGR